LNDMLILTHPIQLEILKAFKDKPVMSGLEIIENVDADEYEVRRHLDILEEQGILVTSHWWTDEGRFYFLADKTIKALRELINFVKKEYCGFAVEEEAVRSVELKAVPRGGVESDE